MWAHDFMLWAVGIKQRVEQCYTPSRKEKGSELTKQNFCYVMVLHLSAAACVKSSYTPINEENVIQLWSSTLFLTNSSTLLFEFIFFLQFI